MPNQTTTRLFLDDCESVRFFCESVPGVTPVKISRQFEHVELGYLTGKDVVAHALGRAGIESLEVFDGAQVARDCATCDSVDRCSLGKFLVRNF